MNDIQTLLDRWIEHSNPSNLSLKSVYACQLMNDGDLSEPLAEFGCTTDDLVLADKEIQERILPHLNKIDLCLVNITSLIEGFVLAAFYDFDDEVDDDEHLQMLKDLREDVYEQYRSMKWLFRQVADVVAKQPSH